MKIGLVFPYSLTKGGGVKEIVFAMQAELEKRGHQAYIITPKTSDHDEAQATNEHILFLGASTDFNSPLHTTVQVSMGDGDEIDRLLAQHQFDILHFHEPWVPMLGRQILSRSKSVNVATFHASIPDTFMSRTVIKVVTPYTKAVLKYIDAFTAVSEPAASYVSTLTDSPVTIIPAGIDLTMYSPPARFTDSRKNKTIFYVGRLENRKGVKHMLQAFALLQKAKPQVSLVIAGNGPDREKLEALAEELRLRNVHFKGYISDEEKLRYLQTSDLFCAPALYGESFGIVLLEAMATGLVTVTGDNPGYSSVMQGLGSLSLINPKMPAEFARRLELLLYETDLRKLWRGWAAEQVPKYSYPSIVSQYEAVYKHAIAHK